MTRDIAVSVAASVLTVMVLWIGAQILNLGQRIVNVVSVPSGSIVMANTSCNELGSGWIEFADVQGRFPIAAGAAADGNGTTMGFGLGESGGTYTTTLSLEQLARHTHRISTQESDVHNGLSGEMAGKGGINQVFSPTDNDGINSYTHGVLTEVLEETGEGAPITIVPAYYPLSFCKKS